MGFHRDSDQGGGRGIGTAVRALERCGVSAKIIDAFFTFVMMYCHTFYCSLVSKKKEK